MYNFRDTTAGQRLSPHERSTESLCFNGIWLEDTMAGFRILHVQGRELASQNVNTYAVGNTLHFQDTTKKPRTIKVTYQLMAYSAADFRRKYNLLNKYLSGEQKKVVFADESDKYFIGTVERGAEVPPGTNSLVGSFNIICTDPTKYSENVASFWMLGNEITIENNGTVPAPISYNVHFNTDCGFIGFVGEGGVLQYGADDEVDGEVRERSQKIFKGPTSSLATELDYSPANQGSSRVNASGATYKNVSRMELSSYGTGAKWHGGIKGKKFTPHRSIYINSKVTFSTDDYAGRNGEIYFQARDVNGKEVASIKLYKYGSYTHFYGAKISILNEAGNKVWEQYKEYDINSGNNPYQEKNILSISKIGGAFRFVLGGETHTTDLSGVAWNSSTNFENAEIGEAVWGIYAYGDKPPVKNMALNYAYIRKENVEYWKDLPNRYNEGEEMTIDGEAGVMYIDEAPRQGDEIAGSIHFLAPPGISTIIVAKSDWADVFVSASIREGWK